MKTVMNFWLSLILTVLATGCALAQQMTQPAVQITAEVRVFDPALQPIEGATVHATFPRYQIGDQAREKYQEVTAQTNRDGIATLSGTAQMDYVISVSKAGYYRTQGPRRGLDTPKGLREFGAGLQKIDLTIRPIRKPVVGISRNFDQLPLPASEGPIGFDLEIGDWVAPFGKGRIADFVFELKGRYVSRWDYEQQFTLRFSQAMDGILSFKHPKGIGSALIWPYEAPLDGYEPMRTWMLQPLNQRSRGPTFDLSGETNYIFRVRSEVDEKGNLVRAMYGVVSGDFIPVGGNHQIGRNISFTYALNPDWTRNLEFDPEKSKFSPR